MNKTGINLFVLITSIFITLIAGEILLRLFLTDPYQVLYHVQPRFITSLDGTNNFTRFMQESPNPGLLYQYTPNVKVGLNITKTRTKKSDVIYFETNSFGLRDKEFKTNKPPNLFRILMIGDSVTVALEIPLNETMIKLLENNLNSDLELKTTTNTSDFEVLNFGVGGYNIIQETELLKEKGLPLSPDLAIFNYVLNDVDYPSQIDLMRNQLTPIDPDPHIATGMCRITFLKIPIPCLIKDSLKKVWFFSHSNKFITNLFGKEQHDLISDLKRNHGHNTSTFLQLQESYKKIKALSRTHHFSVVIVIFPLLIDYSNYPLVQAHRNIRTEAEKNGFYVIDILDQYKNYNYKLLQSEPSDHIHPNLQIGYRIAADTIYKELKTNKLFKDKTVKNGG